MQKISQFVDDWLLFTLSSKLKFAIKVSLSMVIAFMISLYMGWPQSSTAATTIMLIVSAGGVSDSVKLGILRAIGTVLGAVIGLFLIGLFPQERFIYLTIVSLFVFVIAYFYNAYQGDKTILMLTLMMVLMVFKDGKVDDSFLYGVDRTYMTLFGIAVYGTIGSFLWSNKEENSIKNDAIKLVESQLLYFDSFDKKRINKIYADEIKFQNSYKIDKESSFKTEKNLKAWKNLSFYYKRLNKSINLLSIQIESKNDLEYKNYINNYEIFLKDIKEMLNSHIDSWLNQKEIELKEPLSLEFDKASIEKLTYLQRANIIGFMKYLDEIYKTLIKISDILNFINSDTDVILEEIKLKEESKFIFLNFDYFTAALQTFLLFWFTTLFWILFNPVGGFMIVALATILSLITTNSPVKPSILIVLFTFGFVFSALMYVFVLPNLTYGWELALFIFLYTFIAFYMINPKITIFFLIGMFLLGIDNTMNYNFGIFLNILLMFYLFLSVLMIFYYVPFTTKPEILFVRMKKRFFLHVKELITSEDDTIKYKYHISQLKISVNQMKLWASKIDTVYFDRNKTENFVAFSNECEVLLNRFVLLKERKSSNELLKEFKKFTEHSGFKEVIDSLERDGVDKSLDDKIFEQIEIKLNEFKNSLKFDKYGMEEVVEFYVNLGLYQSILHSVIRCHDKMGSIDWKNLKEKKF